MLCLLGEVKWVLKKTLPYLGGGFKDFLFSPLLGEESHFD